MKAFHAVCRGFDKWGMAPIAKGSICVIRLDTTGGIHLVSVNGERIEKLLNVYELHEYFTLGHSTTL